MKRKCGGMRRDLSLPRFKTDALKDYRIVKSRERQAGHQYNQRGWRVGQQSGRVRELRVKGKKVI